MYYHTHAVLPTCGPFERRAFRHFRYLNNSNASSWANPCVRRHCCVHADRCRSLNINIVWRTAVHNVVGVFCTCTYFIRTCIRYTPVMYFMQVYRALYIRMYMVRCESFDHSDALKSAFKYCVSLWYCVQEYGNSKRRV